jgi:hypothetical protein
VEFQSIRPPHVSELPRVRHRVPDG